MTRGRTPGGGALSKQHIRRQHDAEADEQRIGGAPLIPMGVGLRDHLVADDVEHGAAGEGQGEGENGGGEADGEEPQQGAQYLHDAGEQGDDEGARRTDAGGQHGGNDDHALGNVLQGGCQWR